MPAAALLIAIICGMSDSFDGCEEAEVRAASCAAAEAYLRDGLRPHQRLIVVRCDA